MLRIHARTWTEAPADVGREHPYPRGWHPECGRQTRLLAQRSLAADDQLKGLLVGIEAADRRPRLELGIGDTLDAQLALDHDLCLCDCPLGCSAVAEVSLDTRPARVHVSDGRQHLVLHHHQLYGVPRDSGALGHHHGNCLAGIAHLVDRQR